MAASIEIFDHTADMGIRVTAADRKELVAGAIEGLYRIIGQLAPSEEMGAIVLALSGPDYGELLRELLTEVLFRFEHEGKMMTDVSVLKFTKQTLQVVAKSWLVDRARSELHHEVKAITYHELVVRPLDEGWEARIIVDI